ncbi:unnamed protein product [Dimorphilus gyrociliatus]|uniref:SHSP domain-containing protein n=1 Tax=Dimorphilus gyrociliatus TaxID=2664684 RepID=A0A7I8VU99_9ANNE|nr:unnamed protein product [Dimorphilus gyrociliatus]
MAIFISPNQTYNQNSWFGPTFGCSLDDEDLVSILGSTNYLPPFSRRSFCRRSPSSFVFPFSNNSSKVNVKRCGKQQCTTLDKEKCDKTVKKEAESFHHTFDVKDFHPSELKVRVINGSVEIFGKSTKEGEGFYNGRQFWRQINLPDNISPNDIQSSLNDDGILTITTKTVEEKDGITDKKERCSNEKSVEGSEDGCYSNEMPTSRCCSKEKCNEENCSKVETKDESDEKVIDKIVSKEEEKVDKKPSFYKTIDLKHFNIDDLSVKVKGNSIEVTGSAIIEEDGIKCSKKIWRRFAKPVDLKEEDIVSLLDDNEMLIITTKDTETRKGENNDKVDSLKRNEKLIEKEEKSLGNKGKNEELEENESESKKNEDFEIVE